MPYEMRFYVRVHVPCKELADKLKQCLLKKRFARDIAIFPEKIEGKDHASHVIMIVESVYSKRKKVVDYINNVSDSCDSISDLRVIKIEDVEWRIEDDSV